jgi:DnaK suppressor protein
MTTASDHDAAGTLDPGEARRALQDERRRLGELLRDVLDAEELDEPEQGSAGGELYREQALSEAEQLRAEIADVDAALARVAEGTYGRCQACGRPIGRERLEALPATRFCVDDARAAEAEAGRPGERPEAG